MTKQSMAVRGDEVRPAADDEAAVRRRGLVRTGRIERRVAGWALACVTGVICSVIFAGPALAASAGMATTSAVAAGSDGRDLQSGTSAHPDAEGQARGVIRAAHSAALAAGLSARILRMPFREGEAFRKGDILVAFDCDRLKAALKAAQAEARAAALKARSKRQMLKHMAAGRLDVAVAGAEAEKAAAEAEAARARVKECTIRAPWNGLVAEWLKHPHETPSAGEPILKIVSTDKPEVDVIVPAAWLAWLKLKQRFTLDVDGLNLRLEGMLARIGAVVDPVSQTVKVTGRMAVLPPSVRPGMGGVVRFMRKRKQADRHDPAREERRMP